MRRRAAMRMLKSVTDAGQSCDLLVNSPRRPGHIPPVADVNPCCASLLSCSSFHGQRKQIEHIGKYTRSLFCQLIK